MVDALYVVQAVKRVPVACFIGVNLSCTTDTLFDRINALVFVAHDRRQRAPAPLSHDDDYASLAGLVSSKPAIDAILSEVGRADMATKIAAIHFDYTVKLCIFCLRCKRFTKLVCRRPRRTVQTPPWPFLEAPRGERCGAPCIPERHDLREFLN